MRIGSSIALIVIGAIVAFALDVQLAGVDLRLIGYILMAAGVVLLIISLAVAFGGVGRRPPRAPGWTRRPASRSRVKTGATGPTEPGPTEPSPRVLLLPARV
jgi:hypothetical protein